MAFSMQDILEEFADAAAVAHYVHSASSFEDMIEQQRRYTRARNRKSQAVWIALPTNQKKKSEYMRDYYRRPEVQQRRKAYLATKAVKARARYKTKSG